MRKSRRFAPVLALLLMVAAPALGSAQERGQPTLPADTAASSGGLSPMGAFGRSVLLPGWGQAAVGAWGRAGVFFLGHLGNAFMLVKTQGKIGDARDIEAMRVDTARAAIFEQAETDEALAKRIESPDSLNALIGRADAVKDIRQLISAREEQREDWIAWGIFWIMASGADAFVNAHLQDFPMRLRTAPRSDGGYDVGVGLKVGPGR